MIKKILYIGDLTPHARSLQRYKALIDLGINTAGLSFVNTRTSKKHSLWNFWNLWKRIRYRIGFPIDETEINKRILESVHIEKPQCLWIEKALMVRPSTLENVRKMVSNIKILFYSEDDMFAKHNQSKYFLSCLPLYDVVFTTKSYNLNPEELPSLGARKVIFVQKAFDPNTHRPVSSNESDKKIYGSDVNFIGTYESDRKEKLFFLADSEIKVRVWGNGWTKYVGRHPNLQIENKPVYGEDYAKHIHASKINLCFLRKINRDLQTDRSIEIPACGGFMLAERTSEHERLFEENKEAVFFDVNNLQEFLEKVHYYLEHEDERQAIAKAGRERCLKSGYSHRERLTWMLQQIYP